MCSFPLIIFIAKYYTKWCVHPAILSRFQLVSLIAMPIRINWIILSSVMKHCDKFRIEKNKCYDIMSPFLSLYPSITAAAVVPNYLISKFSSAPSIWEKSIICHLPCISRNICEISLPIDEFFCIEKISNIHKNNENIFQRLMSREIFIERFSSPQMFSQRKQKKFFSSYFFFWLRQQQ